ncbi:hypothetical protein DPEC_G00261690 [Dallia pectoralis]|uniref:Uncharacterized protein n=1 Tax=Dallia pectoralis TaxID=75939 RepID=A0ACC2FRM9_DALPE|nr:hypothetical protein DPEC_G00261690 [Dallia pectoralis]
MVWMGLTKSCRVQLKKWCLSIHGGPAQHIGPADLLPALTEVNWKCAVASPCLMSPWLAGSFVSKGLILSRFNTSLDRGVPPWQLGHPSARRTPEQRPEPGLA